MKFSTLKYRMQRNHLHRRDEIIAFLEKHKWNHSTNIIMFKIFLNKDFNQAKKLAHKETNDFPGRKPFYFKERPGPFPIIFLFFMSNCYYCCHLFISSIKECPYCGRSRS